MIQQQTKLCLGTMKLVQWPSLARNVSKLLWPSRVKGQTSIFPYSCSSTMAQAQDPTVDKTASDLEDKVAKDKVKATIVGSKGKSKRITGAELVREELDAVLRVKSLSSALEVCATFNAQERLSALKNLVSVRSRPLPLIQNLAEGLASSAGSLNMKELSDLLFVLGKLSYINEDVLSKTCDAIKNTVKNTNSAAVVGSSISSLRRLQWKDADLLNELSLWIQANFHKFHNPSAFIYTLALQNHSPPNFEELLELVWKKHSKNAFTPLELVNLVWSLHVLNCPFFEKNTKSALHSLFNPKFLEKLRTGQPELPVWVKLLNLHAAVISSSGEKGFKVPDEIKSRIAFPSMKAEKNTILLEVSQLLFKDLDTNLYSTNVPSDMGFFIDLVFNLDGNMNAVPLHLASSKCSRIAVMMHTYHECCHPTREPNGIRTFEMRLLEDSYNVVSLPYHILRDGYAHVHEYFDSVLSEIVKP